MSQSTTYLHPRGVPRHPPLVIALHWLTALAILAGVAVILIRGEVEGRALRTWLLDQHRALGLLVLGLVLARLAVRRLQRHALVRHILPSPLASASAAGHLGLYALMLAVPLLGWVQTSARGLPATFLGLCPIPAAIAPDPDLADTLATWHQYLAWTLIALVAGHVLAALWHRLVRRDGVLDAMLPGPRPRSQAALLDRAAKAQNT